MIKLYVISVIISALLFMWKIKLYKLTEQRKGCSCVEVSLYDVIDILILSLLPLFNIGFMGVAMIDDDFIKYKLKDKYK